MHSASRREEESEGSINNTLRNAKSDAGGSASAFQAIRQSPHPYPSPSQSARARAKNENPDSPRQMRSPCKGRRGDGSEGRTDWQRSRMAFEAMRASSWLSLISTLTTWTGRLYSPPLFSKSFNSKHKKTRPHSVSSSIKDEESSAKSQGGGEGVGGWERKTYPRTQRQNTSPHT